MIKVKHLHKYFYYKKRNQIHVLNDITLDFPEKGLIVLLGASGSGKTTLLNVLSGLDSVHDGEIIFENNVIKKYDPKKWDLIRNEKIGYVFQNYYLLPQLSVYENIALVLRMIGINDPKVIDERVTYILKAVNMYPYRKKRALQLSGGQQQRVAIARALVKNPSLVIADEPTGNLDSKNTIEIMNIIKAISKEKLVILVTHERDIANFYGDRIIEIKDGQIVKDFSNTHDEDIQFNSDSHIYLKDLKQIDKIDNPNFNIGLYTDEEEVEPIRVRLIVKNKTLYIDVDSKIKKQKLVDENSGVIIKDEHFVKRTREEITETTFNLDELDNRYIKREKPLILSIKQSLNMAFEKILRISRKGKFMLFSLAVAGAIVALAISIIMNAITIKPDSTMTISKDYISVNSTDIAEPFISKYLTYDDLLEYGKNDNNFYINSYGGIQLHFERYNGFKSNYSIYGQYQPLDNITKKDLKYGRLPQNEKEILISSTLADEFIVDYGQENGIWNYDHLFSENVKFELFTGKIVGIVKSEIRIIYMDEATVASYNSVFVSSVFAPQDLLFGTLPNKGEALVSQSFYELLSEEEKNQLPFTISGVYKESYPNDPIFRPTEDIIRYHYDNVSQVFVRTNNRAKLVEEL